jgi:hypothetical protein
MLSSSKREKYFFGFWLQVCSSSRNFEKKFQIYEEEW